MANEILAMPKPPRFLTEEERSSLMNIQPESMEKQQVSYRLTKEAREIIDREAASLEVSKTTALEIIIRGYDRAQKRTKEK
jgi:hypothetical protein